MLYSSDHMAPRWLVAVSVMLATIMVILDMTIVNVALPHMMGGLGATADQITWVLTAYIVMEAVFIPLSGYLALRLGRRRLMLLSVTGFVTSSLLCGQADSLSQIVFFRLLQGAFGAAVIPLSQSIMVDIFPGKERGKAMALWGVGVMLGPILGPTLGGYITQFLDWRWVFYINLPVGLIDLILIMRVIVPDRPQSAAVDWFGALLLILGVGSLQTALDRGNQEDWFNSGLIITLSVLAVLGLLGFILRNQSRPDAIVQIRLLKDRNLAAAVIMMAIFGMGLFGVIALQPMMLEYLFHYPAQTTGLIMAPRGLASALGMFIVSRLIQRIPISRLILMGIVLAATGTYLMSGYNLQVGIGWLIWPGLLQGLGMGMVFVSVSTLAYETLPKSSVDQASAIFNLARTLGSAIGISIAVTVMTRMTQVNWNRLGGEINPYNPALQNWLLDNHLHLNEAPGPQLLARELFRQASMLGFNDAYWLIALSFVLMAPIVFIIQKKVGNKR